VARQPEAVSGLKMVAGRNTPCTRLAVAEEAVGLEDGGRGGKQAGAEVERGR